MSKHLVVALALLSSACATTSTSGSSKDSTRSGFPTREKLEQLAASPAPADKAIFGDDAGEVDAWDLIGPLPDSIGLAAGSEAGPWAAALVEAAKARPGMVMISAAMDCVAREAGHFWLERNAIPGDRLRKYLAGRCGAPVVSVGTAYLSSKVDARASDAEVFEHWKTQYQDFVKKSVSSGQRLAGVWFGRKGDRAIAMVATGVRAAHVETMPMRPVAGQVELRGESLEQAEDLRALVTRGRFGWAECQDDPAVRPPAFHFKCPAEERDQTAWIQVMARQPNRVLAREVLGLLVLPGAGDGARYASPSYEGATLAAGAFEATFAGLLNAVRSEAGLKPVEFSAPQSATAAALVPHYFASVQGLEPASVADMVMIGMQAGWSVDGLVRYGHVVSNSIGGTDQPARLLATSLQLPIGRETLLDPEARTLAIGTLQVSEAKGLAAVLATYAHFEQAATATDRAKVFEALAKARAAEGRSAPRALEGVDAAVAQVEADLKSGHVQGREAMNRFMSALKGRRSRPARMHAFMFQTSSLEELKFAPELLRSSDLRVGIAVAISRSEGEPWASYVVLIVNIEDEQT
ncbi:MAG: hypothetical protein QM765_17240 [Myxococcales bacterium]